MQPDAIQANFNLLDRRAIDCGLLEQAGKSKTAIIARTPLCFGFLSGKLNSKALFDERDHRSRWPKKQIERWAEGSRKMLACKSSFLDHTNIQYALRFCLSFPEITSVIPGMLLADEVLENTRSSELGPLSITELRTVKFIYDKWCANTESDDFEMARAQDLGKVNYK
jgi:aryl-alcohol dehydrogenase-like predicted oxidoreductase